MSAVAARKAALLLQKAASSAIPVVTSAPGPSANASSSNPPDASNPASSRARKTYAKKDNVAAKANRSSRSGRSTRNVVQAEDIDQATPPAQLPAEFNNRDIDYEREDRVFVEIDIIDRPTTDTTVDSVEESRDISITQSPVPPALVPENDSDASDFEFDFEETGNLANNGRPRKKRRVDAEHEGQLAISNFTPVEGVNIHRLSAEDVSRTLSEIPKKKAVVIVLQPQETIVLSGTARITPIQGCLSMFSTTISPSKTLTSYPIYAPLTHPLPTLAGTSTQPTDSLLTKVEQSLPTTMRDSCRYESVIFLIQELDSGLDSMPGSAVGLHKVWPDGKGAFGLHGVHPVLRHGLSPVYRYVTPESWQEALQRIGSSATTEEMDTEDYSDHDNAVDRSAPFVMIVKGAKRSGKSTFAREAANRLLQKYERVAYLDTDLGQSEFGIGGSVGLYIIERPLFGPAFTHPTTPLRAHFVGSLNPRLSSEHYISCVAQLIEQYRYEVQYPIQPSSNSPKISEVVPLVINTQGWVKGLGADLLLEIERLAEPSHTFTFVDASGSETDAESVRGAENVSTQFFQGDDYGAEDSDLQLRSGFGAVFQLQPIPVSPLLSRFTASDMRTLSMISYLHAHMAEAHVFWDFSSPLACHAPWQVSFNSVFKELYITGEGADGVLEEDLGLALNGRVVALVERLEGTPEGLYKSGRDLPSPIETNCLGIGLIRSISPDRRTIHLLTPMHAAQLSRPSIMICGELELPVCGMLDWRIPGNAAPTINSSLFGVPWEEVPFLTIGRDQGIGMARRKWRRNIMRRGQGA